MKKLISTLMVLFLGLGLAQAHNIKVIRKGSADGVNFNKVTEDHGFFKSTLKCYEPGPTKCGWTTQPKIGGFTADEIEAYVMLQIDSGDLNGNTNYNGSVYVTWNYDTDTDELIIIMDDGQD